VLQPWSEKEQLKRVLERPLQYSLVTADRMFMLLQWLSYALAAPGDIAEFGIWREGSALLLTDTCEACPFRNNAGVSETE